MPVYMRKNLMSITPDTLSNRSSDEEDYITDPDQMVDYLPQPFRMVNKIVTVVFDAAWERVCHREQIVEKARNQVPVPEYHNVEVVDEYNEPPHMTSSPDGTAMFVALPNSITAIHPVTHNPIAAWKAEESVEETGGQQSEIVVIQSVQLGVEMCLLVTADRAGSCKMFIFSDPYLLFVKDFDGEVPPGSKITKVMTSRDGDFLVLTLESEHGDVWLDVFRIPKDNWMRDVEHAKSEQAKQVFGESNDEVNATVTEDDTSSDITDTTAKPQMSKSTSRVQTPVLSSLSAPTSWTPANLAKPTQVLKVTAPTTSVHGISNPVQPGFSNPALEEWITTIGRGCKHLFTESHLQQRRLAGRSALGPYAEYLKENEEKMKEENKSKLCRCVFVSPGIPLTQGAQPSIISHGIPHFLVCAWEDTNNLCYYNLLKTGKDLEHKPDKVIPFASMISSLALSHCGIVLGVGLRNGSVALLDQHIGTPLAVERVSSSSITHLEFPVSDPPGTPTTPEDKLRFLADGKALVLAGSGSGGLYSVSLNYEDKEVRCCCLMDESKEEELGTILTVPALKNIVMVVTDLGQLSMFNFVTGELLCRIGVPPPYKIDEQQVVALAANGQNVFLRGTKEPKDEDEVSPQSVSALLSYKFETFGCLDSSWRSVPEQNSQPPTLMHTTLAKQRVEWIMASHLRESQERQLQIQRRWGQLKIEAQAR